MRATRARESEFGLYAWHLITAERRVTFRVVDRPHWPADLSRLVAGGDVVLADLEFDSVEDEALFRQEFRLDDPTWQ